MALVYNGFMKRESIRTTLDIPTPVYRKLRAQAAAQGRSMRRIILAAIQRALAEPRPAGSRRAQFPAIVSKGPKVNLTNEQIYEYVEFP
jgi:hypothetical protein